MAASPTNPPAEALLAHAEWVRRLVRLLVADPQDAADVEQETWRAALERPPRETGGLRGWLTVVARNAARKLARGRAARARQMRAVEATPWLVQPRTAELASEVAERAELHGRVVDAVLGLEELYRTPLLMRFFDDLPATEVAARLGVPVETARTRIKRGVALLRERLGGDARGGAAGIAAFLPLLTPRGATPLATATSLSVAGAAGAVAAAVVVAGGAVMSKFAKSAVLVAAVAIAVVGGYQLSHPESGAGSREVAVREPHPPSAPAASEAALLPAPAASDAVREEESRSVVPANEIEAPPAIEGLVLDGSGSPVAGAKVIVDRLDATQLWNRPNYRQTLRGFDASDPRPHSWRTVISASDGGFRFDDVDPDHRFAIAAQHDRLGTGWCQEVVFTGAPPLARVVIALEPGIVVWGAVRDDQGRSIAGASVLLSGTIDVPAAGRPFVAGALGDTARSGEDGFYRSLPLPWRHVAAFVSVYGRSDLGQVQAPWEELPVGVVVVRRDLVVPTLKLLRGRILGPDGQPARLIQAIVPKLGDEAARRQSRKTVAVAAFERDPRQEPSIVERLGDNQPGMLMIDTEQVYGELFLDEDRYEVWLRSPALRFVAIVARDELLGVTEFPQPPVTADITIDSGKVPERTLLHSLQLHFRDGSPGREGAPLAGVDVVALTLTRGREGTLSMGFLNFGDDPTLPPDRIVDLPRTPLSLMMSRDGFVERTCSIDLSRPGAPTELTFAFVPPSGSIALHVEDEEGMPVAKAVARVYLGRELEALMSFTKWITDERGDATIDGLPAGDCLVVVEAPGYAPAATRATIVEGATPVDLLLERGYEVTLQARLADGRPAPGGQLSIRDESGAPLYDDLHPRGHASRLAGRTIRLVDGTYSVRCRVPTVAEGSATFVAAPGIEIAITLDDAPR